MSRQRVHLNQQQLEALCAEWQAILRLQDWDIRVRIARGNGLDLPDGVQGRCHWTIQKRQASLKIMDPVDWNADFAWPQDMEATLVHELVHLHFAPFDDKPQDSPEGIAMEQAIHALSYALIGLKRQARTTAAQTGTPATSVVVMTDCDRTFTG